MIIIGYQGIGKSSIAGRNDIIDLESSNFWFRGERPKNWYIYYCNIAEHLSKQGYIVFVSSHEVVRNWLKNTCTESLYCIFPSITLQNEWLSRLKARYETTYTEKDYKAWVNAAKHYEQNIEDLEKSGIQFYKIDDIDYRLQDVVDYLVIFDAE